MRKGAGGNQSCAFCYLHLPCGCSISPVADGSTFAISSMTIGAFGASKPAEQVILPIAPPVFGVQVKPGAPLTSAGATIDVIGSYSHPESGNSRLFFMEKTPSR